MSAQRPGTFGAARGWELSGPVRSPGSWGARLSGDGRYVAFVSYDRSLVAGDTNDKADVLRIDRATGEVVRVSLDLNGREFRDHAAEPSISADGSRVAFAAGSRGVRQGHSRRSHPRVSVNNAGAVADHWSGAPVLSPVGPLRRLHLPGHEPRAVDRGRGASRPTCVTWSGHDRAGQHRRGRPVRCPRGRGRRPSPKTAATLPSPPVRPADRSPPRISYPGADVFVRDRHAGTTERSASIDGRSTGAGSWDELGRDEDPLRGGPATGRQTGGLPAGPGGPHHPPRGSPRSPGGAAPGSAPPRWPSSASAGAARRAVRRRAASPPSRPRCPTGPDDTNGADDIVVVDLATGGWQPATRSSSGCPGNGASGEPAFSGNGSVLAFTSEADDLAGPANQWLTNVYVRDLDASGPTGSAWVTPPILIAEHTGCLLCSSALRSVTRDWTTPEV